jgi:ABC-type nitrate/sulfonate/bicarbonate transport system ATPase subunit
MAELVSAPLLQVASVNKTFGGRRPVEALRDVTLQVDAGDFVSIVGPSGCGKSTLFNLIAGIESMSAGRMSVQNETDPDRRRLSCGYMFQKDLLFPWRNVLDNAALGLEVAGVCGRAEARQRAAALLPRFGLEGFESHRPAELSGGMRQRVALLRTLLLRRPLLLLDEPFASLDALTRRELQTWLRDTWRTGSQGALLVTHDVREAVLLSDRVYVMSPRPGKIVAEVSVERGPDGVPDALRLARSEETVLNALRLQAVPV